MGFMDSSFEIKITFKDRSAILKFIIYYLHRFFIYPFQLFIFYFAQNFGKSKIYKRVGRVKIVRLTFFFILSATVVFFIIYLIEIFFGVEEDGIFILPGMIAFLVMLVGILRLSWIIVVQSIEFLLTFALSLIKTILELTTKKVYK